MKRITVFGGGTAHGLWDSKGGWSQRLRNYLYRRTIDTNGEEHWEVYNFAIRGDSSQDIKERFRSDLKETMKHSEDAEQITVLHIGGNDAQFIYEEDDVRTSPEDFKANLKEIVEQSSKLSDKTILMGMIPVEEDPKPIPDSGGRSFTTNRMKHYNKIVGEVAEGREDTVLIDLYDQFKGNDDMYQDGLHPNNEGHRIIFEEMKELLQNHDIV